MKVVSLVAFFAAACAAQKITVYDKEADNREQELNPPINSCHDFGNNWSSAIDAVAISPKLWCTFWNKPGCKGDLQTTLGQTGSKKPHDFTDEPLRDRIVSYNCSVGEIPEGPDVSPRGEVEGPRETGV